MGKEVGQRRRRRGWGGRRGAAEGEAMKKEREAPVPYPRQAGGTGSRGDPRVGPPVLHNLSVSRRHHPVGVRAKRPPGVRGGPGPPAPPDHPGHRPQARGTGPQARPGIAPWAGGPVSGGPGGARGEGGAVGTPGEAAAAGHIPNHLTTGDLALPRPPGTACIL